MERLPSRAANVPRRTVCTSGTLFDRGCLLVGSGSRRAETSSRPHTRQKRFPRRFALQRERRAAYNDGVKNSCQASVLDQFFGGSIPETAAENGNYRPFRSREFVPKL